MKTRNGFVSNSSSTSFLLDLRDEKSKTVFEGISGAPGRSDLGRHTVSITGDALRDFYAESVDERWGSTYHGDWIQEYALKVGGFSNLGYVRESDEGMGGYLEDYGSSEEIVRAVALDEQEYH